MCSNRKIGISVKKMVVDNNFIARSLGNIAFSRLKRLKGHFMRTAVFESMLYGLEHCALGARDRRRLDGYLLRLAKRVLQLPHNCREICIYG
jgi:hypothetical protein